MRFLIPSFFLGLFAIACGSSSESSPSSGGAATTTITTITGTTTTTTGFGGAVTTTTTTGSSSAAGGMGGGVTSTTTTTSTTTSSTTTPSTQHGDCVADSDCPGGACVEVTPGGFWVCAIPPIESTTCGSTLDQCCAGMPCPNDEVCVAGPLVPICVGVVMEPHNLCAVDQCSVDADCGPTQVCAPKGALGLQIRACVNAGCKVDADCGDKPGGICAPVQNSCCGSLAGLFCVYPENGCRTDADCPPDSTHPSRYCATDDTTHTASCKDGSPVCPL